MQYTHYFFDMDGTVINSAPGVTHSVSYALEKLGITPPPRDELLCFIGPPLEWSFSHFYGMDPETTKKALALYRECYSAGAIHECLVYDGIEALLKRVKATGGICVLATSKPHEFANPILSYLGLDKYFDFVSGPEMDGTRNAKAEVIAYAIEKMGLTDKSSILMIGDREHDTLGAKEAGVDCVGVLWGFGDADELLSTGAKAVYKTPGELADAIAKNLIPRV